MKKVMVRAWEIAKEAVTKFGGKVKEYFAQALRMAWAEIKKGVEKMQVHKWVTARGANVELHAEYITKETRTTDWGDVIEKEVNRVSINKVIVNGEVFMGFITRVTLDGIAALDLGRKKYVAPPENVLSAVWGEFDAKEAAKKEARKRAEKAESEEMKKKIANGYCPKCHSYCWGDCAN